MTPSHIPAILFTPLLLLAACGGHGAAPRQSTDSRLPERMENIGTAGAMEGRWRVVSAEPMAEPTPRGKLAGPVALPVGAHFLVRQGQVVAEDSKQPEVPGAEVDYPHRVDWLVNETAGGVLRFGVGVTLHDNPAFRSGTLLLGAVLGTTGGTTAAGYVLAGTAVRGIKDAGNAPDVDEFARWRVQLVRDDTTSGTPDFEVTTLDNQRLRLSELRGKIVVLNFWFLACVPCIAEIPALNAIVAKYAADEVVFVGLALDDAAALRAFLTKRTFDYRIAPATRSIWNAFGVLAAPTHLVIDTEGALHRKLLGARHQELDATIAALVQQRRGR
ncbi:MAG: TlpA family protein disulfide reductase [Planctomycetes bacterium]|nr:TlpA family protein disulfide reductase [Planctomycetota bacterium]MCB9869224.1 TlpA family protein disulfide reductase [Planctomycetota bacterium]